MTELRVWLLGPPRVERDGRPVEVDTRKATALLAYLLVTGRAQTRDALVDLLWPDADPSRARAAFRRTLSALNKGLDGPWLVVRRDTVGVSRDGLWCDLDEFRRLLASGDDRGAVRCWLGDLLEGFAVRDAPGFEDWQLREADVLRRELCGALERLVRSEGSLDDARRWLELDPLNESAHRELMRVHARRGDRAAAAQAYRECVAILDRELGVQPLEETAELYRAIAEDRVERPRIAERPPRTTAHPLVGRDRELERMRDGIVVAIEGEAGVGKTRLIAEFIGRARLHAIVARAFEDETTIAYGPFLEALRAATDVPPEVDALLSAGDAPGSRGRLFDAIVGTLCAADVLVFDDMQWADAASLDVLAYLCRRVDGRTRVVVAFRSEDVPAGHPLRRLTGATTLRLERLSEAEVTELAREAGVADLGPRLYRETEGLPLFAVEYLDAIASGEDIDWSLPGGVRELVAARLARVSETASQVLVAAAVIGRWFDPDLVRAVSGRSDEETARALDELVARGIVAESGARYGFRHEKVRDVAYGTAGLARRRLLHRRTAEAIVTSSRGSVPDDLVASHYRLAGRDAEAAPHLASAAFRAHAVHANAEALAHASDALALGHPDEAMLLELIGDLRTLAGDYAGALAAYTSAMDRTADRWRLEHRIGLVHLRAGEWTLASEQLDRAARAADSDADRARVLADSSLAAHRRGDPAGATELATAALDAAHRAGDDDAVAQAHNMLGVLASARGDVPGAREHLERSLELVRDEAGRAAARNNLALVVASGGDVDGALDIAREALASCVAIGDRHREAAIHSNIADILHAAGRTDEARAHQLSAAALFAEVGGALESPEIWKLVEW